MESERKESVLPRTRLKTSAPQGTCLHPPHPPLPPSCSSAQSPGMICHLYGNPVRRCLKMKTFDSTEKSVSWSRSLQPSSEGSSSEPFPSDVTSRSAVAAANAAASAAAAATAAVSTAKAAVLSAKAQRPCSERSLPSDPSSDSLGTPCTGPSFTHKIGHGRLGFKPVSYVVRHPYSANYLITGPRAAPGSSPERVPASGSSPVPGSRSSPVPGSRSSPVSASRSGPVYASRSGPVSASRSGHRHGHGPGRGYGSSKGTGPDSRSGYVCASGTAPCSDPELSPNGLPSFRHLGANLAPNYASWNHYQCWEPQKPPWKFLPISEPVAQKGLWKIPEAEVKCEALGKTLPRGHCLLNNWEEERATNHLDQVPSMQDGSESFYFRHGHQGLLTLQLQSPIPFSTTHKDSYQLPRTRCQPIRGKREAMLEILLSHQICKEVQAEQELPREPFEAESVTHHDYKKELVQAGDPAPTKSHDYCKEQPETFWIQRAPQLPGVSNIKTLDTPFRKNCSFSTPVPLSLEEPFPDGPENYSHQLGQISSLGCQGRGQGGEAGRTV